MWKRYQLSLKLSVNGQARQDANTHDLIIDVPGLIAFATRYYTLMPGDVLIDRDCLKEWARLSQAM